MSRSEFERMYPTKTGGILHLSDEWHDGRDGRSHFVTVALVEEDERAALHPNAQCIRAGNGEPHGRDWLNIDRMQNYYCDECKANGRGLPPWRDRLPVMKEK